MNLPHNHTRLLLAGICAVLLIASGCNRIAQRRAIAAKRPPPAPAPATASKPAKPDPIEESRESVERGNILREQGLEEPAIVEFERAIYINPKMTTAYLGIAEIHKKRGNFGEAQLRFAKAAELEPANFAAQFNNGLMLQLLNRIPEAIRAYINAIWIKPDDFDANLNLATAYLQFGEPSSGLVYAKRAVKLKGDSGPARFNLGAIYAAVDDHENAIVEYTQAAELFNKLSPELLLNLGDSLGKVGRLEEMQNTLEQLIRARPTAVAHERLASCLFREKKYDESLEQFRKALELDPGYYPALNGVGVCLLNKWLLSDKLDQDAKHEAIQNLRKSLQVERRQPNVIDLINRYGS
jgi:tetratricopeptide (TPR) repeat protein